MRYEIYYIKNSVNGKIYVGQTVTGLAKRWGQHKAAVKNKRSKLYAAMRKHGTENFSIHKMCSCKNVEELNRAEEFLIARLNAAGNGYNIRAGGLNYERPINIDKLTARVVSLFRTPSTTMEISVSKFKVLVNLIKILLTMPDISDEIDDAPCDISEEERKRLTKKVLYKLHNGWPGERVDALYIIFKCLCIQKGLLDGQ